MTIFEALAAVMADVQAVRKGDRNAQQGFNFRGIDAVVNAVGPALRAHQVIVTPRVLEHTYGTVEVGKNRTPMAHVTLVAEYTFTAADGSSLSCSVLGEAMDSGDKATPKAMSVAFRTALLQALALPTDEPDPDASTYERAPSARDAILTHHKGDFDAALAGASAHGIDLKQPGAVEEYARILAKGATNDRPA